MTTNEVVDQNLHNIFINYFAKNNCPYMLQLLNKFSRVDFVLTSGNTEHGTSIVGEYKNRQNLSITDHSTAILEQIKFKSLKSASALFGNCPAFYIIEYQECIMIWNLDFNKNYYQDSFPLPVSNSTNQAIEKVIYHLDYADADIIIGKNGKNGSWVRASVAQLNMYIEQKKIQQD